jgi:putative membrane protein
VVKPPKIDRQREHQANERTFLAWLRTAIALIGLGLAIARFGIFLRQLQASLTEQTMPTHHLWNSEILGIGLIAFGVLAIALGAWRYNQTFWQIERSDYRPSRFAIWVMTAIVMILGILSIPLLLWRTPSDQPRQRPTSMRSLPKTTIAKSVKTLHASLDLRFPQMRTSQAQKQ